MESFSATTVEWLGIGGYMQQFLDACWLYGDKEKISNTYMQPIVMSTTYGEREAEHTMQCMGDTWRSAVLRVMRICRGYYYVSAQ